MQRKSGANGQWQEFGNRVEEKEKGEKEEEVAMGDLEFGRGEDNER